MEMSLGDSPSVFQVWLCGLPSMVRGGKWKQMDLEDSGGVAGEGERERREGGGEGEKEREGRKSEHIQSPLP